MATVTLAELDDGIFQEIVQRATDNKRSIEDEIAVLLKLGLSARADRDRLVMVADAIAELTPPGHQSDAIELLREERSR